MFFERTFYCFNFIFMYGYEDRESKNWSVKKIMKWVGAGIGSYNGYQALSIGASGRIFDGLVVKAAVGSSENGHAAFGGGVSYSW